MQTMEIETKVSSPTQEIPTSKEKLPAWHKPTMWVISSPEGIRVKRISWGETILNYYSPS